MKKLTSRYKYWLFKRQYFEDKKRRFKTAGRIVYVQNQHGRILVRAPQKIRQLPRVFCLIENTKEVVGFLDSLRSRFANPVKHRRLPIRGGSKKIIGSYFDFSTISKVTPSAALVLAAEYDRLQARIQDHTLQTVDQLSLIDVESWNKTVLSTLHDLGFFNLLGITHALPPDGCGTLKTLEFVSGRKVDSEVIGNLTQKFEKLIQDLGLDQGVQIRDFYGPVIEAVENVHLHAYPQNGSYRHKPIHKWWLTAAVDTISRSFHVVVFDQGVSIPASLPKSPIANDVLAWLSRLFGDRYDSEDCRYDGEAIRAAMQVGRSSTQIQHRGKGLHFMRSLLEGNYEGELRIMSRNGLYRAITGGEDEVEHLNQPIGGTLVEWRIRTRH